MARKRTKRSAKDSTNRGRERRGFRVLVVDDAEGIRSYLANLLELKGYDVDTAEDGRCAIALLEGGANPDVVILDVMMPGLGGLETLVKIRELDADIPVVMLSVVGTASTIVEAMRLGAVDYLGKPFEEGELEAALESALEFKAFERERERMDEQAADYSDVVWAGEAMQRIQGVLERVAETDVTILIHGESGVGKEIVARASHEISPRATKPFVKVNCAALPDELLESELFGYEKGAFTGAVSRKHGKFEAADGGTMFLDEIGEMTAPLQAKLLQVLQDSVFTRIGANTETQVDVRVVCATNRRLADMVREGGFREDLFFRLNVVNVEIPPLRERREEIPDLVEHFLQRFSLRYGKHRVRVSDQLMQAFDEYPFPGNVRELENMIKRVIVLESESSVLEGIRQSRGPAATGSSALRDLFEEVEQTAGEIPLREVGRRASYEAEREVIEHMLHRTNWNRKQAARLLGVSYKTLLQKIRGCGLEPS
ncbi:MAG: sigma-54-dependent Fis family transcriptional regulator [Deltaproteobacteria bacterium]|nr:sigma-54-dependent Fis family transcriptional regulator [Deltaproteobacteria bacterium]